MKKNSKGFSLIEMIIAVGIFAIVSVSIAELFIMTSRAMERGTEDQKMNSEARLIMPRIVNLMRTGTIDYSYYSTPISSPVEELAVIDEHDQLVIFRKSDTVFTNTDCPDEDSTPCLEISEDGGTTFYAMSSVGLAYPVVKFYLDPSTDPFAEGGPDIQPRVTIVLGVRTVEAQAGGGGPVYLQTTVSSRKILRGGVKLPAQ